MIDSLPFTLGLLLHSVSTCKLQWFAIEVLLENLFFQTIYFVIEFFFYPPLLICNIKPDLKIKKLGFTHKKHVDRVIGSTYKCTRMTHKSDRFTSYHVRLTVYQSTDQTSRENVGYVLVVLRALV